MSWPIGYGNAAVRFRSGFSGTLFANGIQIGDPGGWIELPAPACCPGPQGRLSIRARVSSDARGNQVVFAEQIALAGRRYPGMHEFMLTHGSRWFEHIVMSFYACVSARAGASMEMRRRPAGTRPHPDYLRAVPSEPSLQAVQSGRSDCDDVTQALIRAIAAASYSANDNARSQSADEKDGDRGRGSHALN